MILAGDHAGTDQRTRFRVEAEAVARLHHPNIVQIYEVGEADGRPFFSMEYVGGGSLATRLKAGPLPARDAADLVETLARAVQHAHQRGVIHRDLKPVNILLTDDGVPRITDFGLAKQCAEAGGEEAGPTRSGEVMGTPSYMAPEQAQGQTDRLGPAVDVYALGAVLYQCLTGVPPFRGATMVETLQQVVHADPVPPSRRRTGIDRDLDTICLKALAKDPGQRYGSALALAQDLERYQAGEPILARRAGLVRRLWRRARRRPLVALAVPILLILAIAAVFIVREVRDAQARADLLRRFENDLPEAEWTAAAAEKLERLLDAWRTAEPEQAEAARRKLLDRFAVLFRASLRQPRLEPQDVTRLQNDLAWLTDRDAELARVLGRELAQRCRAWQTQFLLRAPWQDVDAVFAARQVQVQPDRLVGSGPAPVWTKVGAPGRVRLEATFDVAWQDSSRIGLLLHARPGPNGAGRGYAFRLVTTQPRALPAGIDAATPVAGGAAPSFREAGGAARLEMLRGGVVLRSEPIVVAKGPLTLAVAHEGDRLEFQVNDAAPVVFFDAIPVRPAPGDVFALDWPAKVGLTALRASVHAVADAPSPLERGDQLFDEGRFGQALALYEEQAIAAPKQDAGREARYKAALCLIELKREDAAAAMLEPLVAEPAGPWPLRATCRLWLLRLEQKRLDQAAALSTTVRAHFGRKELASYVSQDSKRRLLAEAALRRVEFLLPSPTAVARLQEMVALADLIGSPVEVGQAHYNLTWAHALVGDNVSALAAAARARAPMLEYLRSNPNDVEAAVWVSRLHAWLQCRCGQSKLALAELDAFAAQAAAALRERFPDDPVRQLGSAPLALTRVRLLTALGRWEDAEKELDGFLERTPASVMNYTYHADAWLMKGFLCERRGTAEEAGRAWREGLYPAYLRKTRNGTPLGPGGQMLVSYSILASLADDLPDAEAERLWQWLSPALAGDPLMTQLSTALRPSAAVLRGAWRTANGKAAARRIAFLDVAPAEYTRLPIVAILSEKIRLDALGGQTSPTQEEVIWGATYGSFEQVLQGKLSQFQLLQLVLAWKGQTGIVGWKGAAPQLDPVVRGPLAYILGHRYLRLNTADGTPRRDDARMFFRTALQDAPAGSSLRTLADQELQRLGEK